MAEEVRVGAFRGEAACALELDGLEDELRAGVLVSRPGRANPVVRVSLGGLDVAAKRYPARHAHKARRHFELASALQGAAPRPVAWLAGPDRAWYLAEYQEDATSFHTELLRLFHEDFLYGRVLDLMDPVAAAARAMHEKGVLHGDLGNQNILVRRTGDASWADVRFLDLDRGRLRNAPLDLRERARDLSRLTLPSKLRRVFLDMYWRERYFAGEKPPAEFTEHERRYRRRFAWHAKTRALRHPLREARRRRERAGRPSYPAPRELFLWDERTDQAIGTTGKRERLRYVSPRSLARMALATATALPSVALRFRKAREGCFAKPVAMAGRIGMTLSPTRDSAERELALLRELHPAMPVLLRFHHHRGPDEWAFVADHAKRLHALGHPVTIALVQDRRAVREPALWARFCETVLDAAGGVAEQVEVGHATNRTKWGIWSLADYARLLEPFRGRTDVKLLGPAVNDFEYPYVVASLNAMPRGVALDALSLHLYVDRRGPPENRQSGFSALDKFVLARMLAKKSPRCGDSVVVTEVNWTLVDPNAHPFAPYASPTTRKRHTTVTEDEYSDYMVRYLLLALCSGMVDRVFWWRLVNGGFGLVDDAWRRRPAYEALKTFLRELSDAEFLEKRGEEFRFRKADGTEAAVVYALKPASRVVSGYTRAVALGGGDADPEKPGARPILLT